MHPTSTLNHVLTENSRASSRGFLHGRRQLHTTAYGWLWTFTVSTNFTIGVLVSKAFSPHNLRVKTNLIVLMFLTHTAKIFQGLPSSSTRLCENACSVARGCGSFLPYDCFVHLEFLILVSLRWRAALTCCCAFPLLAAVRSCISCALSWRTT